MTRADYLSGRTAIHFAAVNGHVRCIRLVVADFVPSVPFESINAQTNGDRGGGSDMINKNNLRFVNLLYTHFPIILFVLIQFRVSVDIADTKGSWK